MKKLITAFLCLVTVGILAGCGEVKHTWQAKYEEADFEELYIGNEMRSYYLYQVKGVVVNEDYYTYEPSYTIKDENDNEWIIVVHSDNDDILEVGAEVTVYGSYYGSYSGGNTMRPKMLALRYITDKKDTSIEKDGNLLYELFEGGGYHDAEQFYGQIVDEYFSESEYLDNHVEENEPEPAEEKVEGEKVEDKNNNPDLTSLKFGQLIEYNDDGNGLVVIKAKIEPSYSNDATIQQNYHSMEDFIRNQGGNEYSEIQYWAVADMDNGEEAKVMSFAIVADTIEAIDKQQVVALDMGDYVKDLWIHDSLQ